MRGNTDKNKSEHGQFLRSESKETEQNWTRPENLDICFGAIFDYYCSQVSCLEGRLGSASNQI